MSNLKLITNYISGQPQVTPYYNDDTVAKFLSNKGHFGSKWYWHSRIITYCVNSQGFRERELSVIDWNNSIIAFGCSITFGVGISNDQSWPKLLQRLAGIPVINLGLPGASIPLIFLNSHKIIAAGVKPRAVVCYWPTWERFLAPDPTNSEIYKFYGQWNIEDDDVPEYINSLDSQYRKFFHNQLVSLLPWSCPVVNLTWIPDLPSIDHYQPWIDLARDQIHPGPESHLALAKKFHLELQALGFS